MPRRIPHRAKFLLERLIVRGPMYRLLVVAAFIVLISVTGGLVVWQTGEFDEPGKAIWWAFLRLTDPGYLGDDEGVLKRTVSTVLTVLGYVLFLGALVAIMIQWLNTRLRHLEQGLTPIAQKHHLLVLGWTNRTPAILRELLASEARVKRFLRRRGALRGLNIVVLAEDVDAALVQDLRDRLGKLWSGRRITLRTGTPLRLEHLRRVDFRNASAIVLPAADYTEGTADTADTRAIKVLMSIAEYRDKKQDELDFPLVVGEVFDARRVGIAYEAYTGPLEILSSDEVVARLVAQSVRHPGLSYVHHEILSYGEGNELYVREVEGFEGAYVSDLAPGFPGAIVLGLVRPEDGGFRALLDPSAEPKVRAGDRLVLLAPDWGATEPSEGFRPAVDDEALRPVPRAEVMAERRLLVLGWSHRVPALLAELESYEQE